MAIIHAKPVPIQITVNSLAYDAMTQAAAARGLTFSRYASQLLEAAWSARVKPTGDDPELEVAVAAPPPRDSQTAQKLVERTNDAERRLHEANKKIERLEREARQPAPPKTGEFIAIADHKAALAKADGRVAEAERLRDVARRELSKYDDELRDALRRAAEAERAVATVRTEVAGVGQKILDRERWRTAFERTRARLDKMARSRRHAWDTVRTLEGKLAARAGNRDPHPSKYRAQADALPASIAKGIRSLLGLGVSIADVSAQYDVPAEVVRMFKK